MRLSLLRWLVRVSRSQVLPHPMTQIYLISCQAAMSVWMVIRQKINNNCSKEVGRIVSNSWRSKHLKTSYWVMRAIQAGKVPVTNKISRSNSTMLGKSRPCKRHSLRSIWKACRHSRSFTWTTNATWTIDRIESKTASWIKRSESRVKSFHTSTSRLLDSSKRNLKRKCPRVLASHLP